MERNRGGRARHPDVLTPAEWRVLDALREGGTNAEIAARLGISTNTVGYHVSNMLAKLELRDRRALAAWRPDAPRRRLGGVLAVPAVVWSVGRPLMWVGVGAAALAGVLVVVVALVALEGIVKGDDNPPAAVASPPATPTLVNSTGNTKSLTVTVSGEGGTVVPTGTSTHPADGEVTLTASWNDAAHDFDGWGGDCAGETSTCVLTMDADKTVTAAFTALSADRCAEPTDADCIRAVYLGASGHYAQVADIPAVVLLTPDTGGHYHVQRGQQVTVVTAAPLPAGWTGFDLQLTPLGTPSPVSASQLIQPVGTTYTFTVTDDERGASLITFGLMAARPHPVRPTHEPVLGDVVVTTEFLVPTLRYNRLDTIGAATMAGSYAFLTTAGDATSAIDNFGRLPGRAVELLIHPADASGTSRTSLYDSVRVGESLEYRLRGRDCGYRFKVTSVTAASARLTFGIEHVRNFGGRCLWRADNPSAARDATFVWGVSTGLPVPDGVQVLLRDEPTGQGTYRIAKDLPWVIDVPSGIEVVFVAIYLPERAVGSNLPLRGVLFRDAATDSTLHIDPETGRDFYRFTTSDEVGALFDQIMASIRRVE